MFKKIIVPQLVCGNATIAQVKFDGDDNKLIEHVAYLMRNPSKIDTAIVCTKQQTAKASDGADPNTPWPRQHHTYSKNPSAWKLQWVMPKIKVSQRNRCLR